ncbi:phage head-binding domain-containing protein [Candidatus Erwinia dacicola]|uniref:Tail spike protein n=1 Tax=Candidatus Erwinia dacicola TaxID=252393 RepID=A0A328TQW2_9GAMM|nr:phage head-binding domain-containing protein [Candidatus Erwinia dacicola]RAP72780.1 tail spike protein [Candidatus Erwinia dacicola]RAP73009.1 tail spike protein [Candidatus Erwinia dacicola]
MSEITANVVIGMPSQLFTLARSFKAVTNGKIYIGKIDTDPSIPSNQISVYIESEDGTLVPVAQPIVINAGGYPVYNGQITKFVTVEGHSMAVYDSYGAQQFYFSNVLSYEPDQFKLLLQGPGGADYIGTNHRGTLQQDLDVIDIRTSGQPFDTLLTTPKDVEIDTALTISSKAIGTVAIKGRPKGRVSVSKDATKQIRGFDFTEKGVVLDSVSISGSNVLPGDNWATFCTYVEASSGKATYINSEFKDATAAVNCEGNNTVFAFNRVSGMVGHASIDAGGYGFLTGAVTDALIIGNSADAAGGDPASPLRSRHFAYISDFAGDSSRINTGVRIIGNYADWRRVSQAQFSAPTIKGRGQNGLIIANNQLRGGNVPVHVTADSTDVLRLTITGNQFLNYEKNVTNHPCAGVWLYATPARDYIREFIISNNVYAATRSVATDFARTLNGVWLQKTTQGVISDSTMRLPGLAVPVSMEDTSRVIVSNIEDFTGDANPYPFFAFAGACSDITVSNIVTNRAIYGSDVSNVTDLTVDYQRKLILLSTNGTITNSDPHLLMQSVSVTGAGEITVVFRSHVTTKALDAIVAKGNRIAGPHVFVNRTGKSLVCTIYNTSGALVPLSTSTVGIDFILGS